MNYERPSTPVPGREPTPETDLFGWATIFHWASFVLRAPLRRPWVAGVAFFFVFSLCCAAIFVVPYRYQVQATLLAGYPQATALAPMARGQATPAAEAVLLRRDNLRKILRDTNFVEQYLEKRPWAIRKKDELFEKLRGKPRNLADLEQGLLDTLEERLWVDVRREATVVITFRWWDPELARQVVEAAQNSFLDARRGTEIVAVGEAIRILESQQDLLHGDVELAIAAFERKQEELRIATPKPRQAPRQAGPDLQLVKLQEELASKQRLLEEVEEARRHRIAQLQGELVQQESIYAANHPVISSTRRVLQSLSEPPERLAELQGEVERLERQVLARGGQSERRASAIAPAYEAISLPGADDSRLDFERGQLESLLRQHADLRGRIQGLRLEQELAEAAFTHRYSVVTPAQLPRGPIKPYPLMFFIGGLMGGLAFAIFATTAVDLRAGRVLERWQVEHGLDLPVLMDTRIDRSR
jgi:uncharacterized protein involved in exopolysaccharide biosynthesis